LKLELDDIKGIDMSDFGFELDLDEDDKEVVEDDYDCTPPEEPKAKLGDIYQLGNHRLMCGDSTSEEDVSKLMNGELADLVVTDPPYNVAIVGGDHKIAPDKRIEVGKLTIENDKMSDKEFQDFLNKSFKNMYNSLKLGGVYYIWYASREHIKFETALNNNNLIMRQQLIWNKNRLICGMQDYQWKHEPCLYGWKDGAGHYFVDDRTQTTVIEDKKPDIKKMKKEELVKLLEEIYSDKISTTIINEDRPNISDLHPTMKPVKLIARQVKNSSRINETVLDLFGGSGTTLIACEQLNRNCYMMEFDCKYIQVIIERYIAFTGNKVYRLNDDGTKTDWEEIK
jgi:DNA modification methylase